MKIRILGWKATGLRCADGPVDLSAGGSHLSRVALIQMPNGTGKTTALDLLRGTLNGSVRLWSHDRIEQLRDKDTKPNYGEFRLDLSVDGAPLTFTTKLDFRDNTATMRTSSSLSGGLVNGYEPPTAMRRFLGEKFVELFIFDGELAGKMLQASETRAANAIDTLCQLDLIEKVTDICDEKWTIETRVGGARTEAGLTTYHRRLKALKARISDVKEALRDNEDKRDKFKLDIEALSKRIDELYRQNKDASEEYAEIKEMIGKREAEISSEKDNIMMLARNPSSLSPHLSRCLIQFKDNLDILKLPDVTSRQFFTELAKAELCVCGRPLGEHERKRLLNEADQYLGDDISGIVNAIKQDVDIVSNSMEKHSEALDAAIDACKAKQDDLELLNTNMHALRKKLDKSGQAELQELQDKHVNLSASLREALEIIQEITRRPDPTLDKGDDSWCLAWLERQQYEVSNEIARITQTVKLKDKIDLIADWLGKARNLARDNVKKILIGECNRRLDRILGASPLRIAMIDNHIVLDGQAGASAGQTLAVGYTFLATLLHRGQHEFPLVVDSPAGPLDDIVRREVAGMVPDLCEQFIAFMIKTEREDFLPALQEAANNDVSYITIYRKNERTIGVNLEGVSEGNIVRTPQYTLVQGQKFFEEFTLIEC
jgi:DNA sulfur modification protein DndD